MFLKLWLWYLFSCLLVINIFWFLFLLDSTLDTYQLWNGPLHPSFQFIVIYHNLLHPFKNLHSICSYCPIFVPNIIYMWLWCYFLDWACLYFNIALFFPRSLFFFFEHLLCFLLTSAVFPFFHLHFPRFSPILPFFVFLFLFCLLDVNTFIFK